LAGRHIVCTDVPNIVPYLQSQYRPGTILGAALRHVVFLVTVYTTMLMDRRKCEMWGKIKMANAIKAVKSEEMELKKKIEDV